MRKIEIKTTFLAYDTDQELPESERRLLLEAKKRLNIAYAPYSKFQVSAAVLLANDEIVASTNYENASYPISVCAEHSALIAAANRFPGVPPLAVAITVKAHDKEVGQPALPCGSCRQVIMETQMKNGHPIKIILQGETGEVYVFEKGEEILPLAFNGSFL
ncbi:MAG: cytidine deaminase [Bacteroidota bacterium]